MAGENFEKNLQFTKKAVYRKTSRSNVLFPLLWLCSDLGLLFFDSGLEFELDLFVFSSCCSLQLIV